MVMGRVEQVIETSLSYDFNTLFKRMMGSSIHMALTDSDKNAHVDVFVKDELERSKLPNLSVSLLDEYNCENIDLMIICVNLASVEGVMKKLVTKSGNFVVTDISSVKGVVFHQFFEESIISILSLETTKRPNRGSR